MHLKILFQKFKCFRWKCHSPKGYRKIRKCNGFVTIYFFIKKNLLIAVILQLSIELLHRTVQYQKIFSSSFPFCDFLSRQTTNPVGQLVLNFFKGKKFWESLHSCPLRKVCCYILKSLFINFTVFRSIVLFKNEAIIFRNFSEIIVSIYYSKLDPCIMSLNFSIRVISDDKTSL